MTLRYLSIATATVAIMFSRSARACGASGPDGVAYCSLSEHREAERPKWALGLSGLYTSTNIHFSSGLRGDETREELLMAIAHMPSANVTMELGLGAMLGGHLDMPDGRHEFSPGPAAFVGTAWRVIDDREFLILNSVLSFSANRTELGSQASEPYEAFDLRLGAVLGITLFDALSSYVPLRVFGGPIYWHHGGQSVTGTDAYHYQVGLGIVLHIQQRLHFFVEGIPVGEKALAGGLTWEMP